MKYRKLTLENFGPYYGQHELTFNRDRGVWIVYGDNGRGKTTLLNAFRYALYGKVLGRRAERRAHDVANVRHASETGQHEFKTILDFEHDDVEYRVTRHFRAGHDPEHLLVVEKAGTPLTDSDADAVMMTVAPESISQFFLFDGELLRQYEDLRDPGVDSGRRMREEVDRLLGVHAVENAIHDLKEVSASINKEKARVLAANAKARNLATAMQEAGDKRDALVAALAELKVKGREYSERLAELEEALAQHEQARLALAQIDALKETRTKVEVKLQQALEALGELSPDAWRVALLPATGERLAELRAGIQESDQRRVEAIVAHRTAHHLETHSVCPVCDTGLSEAHRSEVVRRTKTVGSADNVERLDRVVSELRGQADTLQELRDTAAGALLAERETAVRTLELELSEIAEDIAEQEEDLRGIDESSVRRRQRDRDNVKMLLEAVQRDLRRTTEDIQEQDNVIARFKDELARLDVTTDPVLELRDRVSTDLLGLLGAALAQYQDDLLGRIEDQASKLFMEIRSEDEYARLRIREGYGLSIVDDAGREVVGHSAGYEHLVALSLIAALQRSSPVQGPIVMDSPFGRLDDVHTRNVVAALPQIADQVVLLAFAGEFDRDSAVDALGGALAAEYTLERVSSRHTRVVPGAPS